MKVKETIHSFYCDGFKTTVNNFEFPPDRRWSLVLHEYKPALVTDF